MNSWDCGFALPNLHVPPDAIENRKSKIQNPLRVLVVGPTPPPYHGVATFTRDLLEQTKDKRFELLHLDTSDRRDLSNLGKWDLTNIRLGLLNAGQMLRRCVRPGAALVYIPISQNVPAFLRDASFILGARALRTRVVLHLHGGHFRQVYDQEGGAFFRATARLALRAAAAVIVLADEFREVFKGLVPDERLYVVENGVPDPGAWALYHGPPARVHSLEARAARTEPETGSQEPQTVLFMSTLTRTKGILELIKALELMRPARPGAEIHLKVAGAWQDESARTEAEEFIARAKLGARISFAGNVAGADKAAFLASGQMLCLPTRYPFEGQPLAILEAMAAGLPVLATKHGAIGSTVLEGVTGKLIPKDATPEMLAAALSAMLADRAALRQCGAKARERYLERYTLEACHRRLFEVFEKALGS